MNSKRLKAFVQLSRPVNVLITLVSIPAASWIAGGTKYDVLSILFAALTGALVTAGANAINDSFDIEIDRINRPDRPLPLGVLTVRDAQWMWFLVSLASIGINIFVNISALLIVIFSIVLLYYYSAWLKRTVVAGNVTIGLMTGMAFIYGGVVVGRIEQAVIPALFAFLVNFSREMIKDVEDVEGDRREQAVTLPVKYGIRPALILATGALALLVSVTLVVIKYSVYNIAFMYIISFADILLCISGVMLWRNPSPVQIRHVSTNLKISMVIGLVAIITGSM